MVFTEENDGVNSPHDNVSMIPQNTIGDFGVYKTGRQVINHGYASRLPWPNHNDDGEKEQDFRFSLKCTIIQFVPKN